MPYYAAIRSTSPLRACRSGQGHDREQRVQAEFPVLLKDISWFKMVSSWSILEIAPMASFNMNAGNLWDLPHLCSGSPCWMRNCVSADQRASLVCRCLQAFPFGEFCWAESYLAEAPRFRTWERLYPAQISFLQAASISLIESEAGRSFIMSTFSVRQPYLDRAKQTCTSKKLSGMHQDSRAEFGIVQPCTRQSLCLISLQ